MTLVFPTLAEGFTTSSMKTKKNTRKTIFRCVHTAKSTLACFQLLDSCQLFLESGNSENL